MIYNASRALNHYESILDYYKENGFLKELFHLKNGSRWLDVGAGDGSAAFDYIFSKKGRADVMAISVERKNNKFVLEESQRPNGRLKYLTGKFIEEYSVDELGRFDFVTDVYGALSYAPQIDVIMQKIGDLMQVGAIFFGNLKEETEFFRTEDIPDPDKIRAMRVRAIPYGLDSSNSSNSAISEDIKNHFATLTIFDRQGKKIDYLSWFDSITCLKRDDSRSGDGEIVIKLIKTCDKVVVPKLKTVEFIDFTPPLRAYQLE